MMPIRSTRDGSSGRIDEATHYVLGGEHVGTAVAERLQADDRLVSVIDESYGSTDLSGIRGDPGDLEVLEGVEMTTASTVVVATRSDRRNLLIAQLVRAHFDVSRVVVLVNVPERLTLVAEAGHDPVCATTALSDAIVADV